MPFNLRVSFSKAHSRWSNRFLSWVSARRLRVPPHCSLTVRQSLSIHPPHSSTQISWAWKTWHFAPHSRNSKSSRRPSGWRGNQEMRAQGSACLWNSWVETRKRIYHPKSKWASFLLWRRCFWWLSSLDWFPPHMQGSKLSMNHCKQWRLGAYHYQMKSFLCRSLRPKLPPD